LGKKNGVGQANITGSRNSDLHISIGRKNLRIG
jgi:hypothetical protein